ncbi:Uncharacterized protein APZ42_025973 [Daphnia magna]|uniref:Uncharacterized protein n=1 Tax=Daphnia magna TaxID=35525 RepID=A0A164SLD5_9CRUS|nr:Uncharacterized protein APZ42_025973 [Daphnia magna]
MMNGISKRIVLRNVRLLWNRFLNFRGARFTLLACSHHSTCLRRITCKLSKSTPQMCYCYDIINLH